MVRKLYSVGSLAIIRLVRVDGKASVEGIRRELGLLNLLRPVKVLLADYEHQLKCKRSQIK